MKLIWRPRHAVGLKFRRHWGVNMDDFWWFLMMFDDVRWFSMIFYDCWWLIEWYSSLYLLTSFSIFEPNCTWTMGYIHSHSLGISHGFASRFLHVSPIMSFWHSIYRHTPVVKRGIFKPLYESTTGNWGQLWVLLDILEICYKVWLFTIIYSGSALPSIIYSKQHLL